MKPLPYQKTDIRRIESLDGRALLAHDMGLGKTFMALGYLHRNPSTLPAVVVCPAVVKWFWQQEAMQVTGIRSTVLEGQKPGGFPRHPITIINYDILRFWIERLKQLNPRTVVLDECHMVMSPRAKRTRAVEVLCNQVPHVLALSGTPMLNKPIEMFTILNILRPNQFRERFTYAQKFCSPKWTPWGWKYDGASNSKKLHRKLVSTCMIRRRKVDVLKDLPPKFRQVIPLPMHRAWEYKQADEDFLTWLRHQDEEKAERASRAVQLAKAGYLLQLAAKLKLKAAVEWINEWLKQNPDEKLVVFAHHRKCLEALRRRLEAKSVVIDGSVTGRRRNLLVEQFQTESKTRLLLGNILAAGVGITLTAAHNVVFVEITHRPGDHIQAEDRSYRIGTTETVWCTYLVAHGTIEERLCRILQRKQKVLSSVLDGGPVEGDLNIFDELMTELKDGEQ